MFEKGQWRAHKKVDLNLTTNDIKMIYSNSNSLEVMLKKLVEDDIFGYK